MSPRRYEFLETLFRMVDAEPGPVHYADLAKAMGVSRWTAYDMMRELARDGMVDSVYSRAEPGYPGRSQVRFSVTEKGRALLESYDKASRTATDWYELKRSMFEKLGVALERRKGFEFFKKELASNSSVLFCAAVISALVVEAKRVRLDLVTAAKVLGTGIELEAGPSLFVGIIAGSLLVGGLARRLPAIGPLLERFAQEVRHFAAGERRALMEFTREVLGMASHA